jgi:hypothetical protein
MLASAERKVKTPKTKFLAILVSSLKLQITL